MQNSDPEGQNFLSHRTLMFDSFTCISFDFECFFIFKVAFNTTDNDADVGHF